MTKESDAHVIALEWLKQLITLSSGIVVFSGTFVGTILKKPNWSLYLLGASWLLFVLSIVFSLETISTITYSRILNNANWTVGKGQTLGRISKWCFVGGIVLFGIFAAINIFILSADGEKAALGFLGSLLAYGYLV